jgi:hypothetical protein
LTAKDRTVLLRASAEGREVMMFVGAELVYGVPEFVGSHAVRYRERGGSRVRLAAPSMIDSVRLTGGS